MNAHPTIEGSPLLGKRSMIRPIKIGILLETVFSYGSNPRLDNEDPRPAEIELR
jgi:hypothetical protein